MNDSLPTEATFDAKAKLREAMENFKVELAARAAEHQEIADSHLPRDVAIGNYALGAAQAYHQTLSSFATFEAFERILDGRDL